MKGDDFLSANDAHIWALFYHVIITYKCHVIFKIRPRHVGNGIDEHIQFFVDENHSRCNEVIGYLEDELKSFECLGEEAGWNCRVTVYKFSGVHEYTNREEVHRIAKESLITFRNLINANKNKLN